MGGIVPHPVEPAAERLPPADEPTVDVGDRRAAGERHRAGDALAEELEHDGRPLVAGGPHRVQVRPADRARVAPSAIALTMSLPRRTPPSQMICAPALHHLSDRLDQLESGPASRRADGRRGSTGRSPAPRARRRDARRRRSGCPSARSVRPRPTAATRRRSTTASGRSSASRRRRAPCRRCRRTAGGGRRWRTSSARGSGSRSSTPGARSRRRSSPGRSGEAPRNRAERRAHACRAPPCRRSATSAS